MILIANNKAFCLCLIVALNKSWIKPFRIIINIFFLRYSLVWFPKDFAPVLDLISKPSCLFPSLISTHIHIHNLLFWLLLLSLSQCFSRFYSNKNEAKENAKDEVGNWGLFFCYICALCYCNSKMVELVSWMSFLFTWMGLLKRRFLLLAIWSSWVLNRFLLTWIHFQ